MSESKPYDQRVREIAEEMAKVDNVPGSWLGEDETIIPKYLPIARNTVSREEKIARDAWEEGRLSWFREIGELEEGETAYLNLKEYLAARGLIPTPERKEAGEV